MTPLLLAIYESQECPDLEIIDKLVNKYPNQVNTQNSKELTPLHYAVKINNLKLVRYLISKGANIHLVNRKGKTPLNLAEDYENEKIVNYLREINTNFIGKI